MVPKKVAMHSPGKRRYRVDMLVDTWNGSPRHVCSRECNVFHGIFWKKTLSKGARMLPVYYLRKVLGATWPDRGAHCILQKKECDHATMWSIFQRLSLPKKERPTCTTLRSPVFSWIALCLARVSRPFLRLAMAQPACQRNSRGTCNGQSIHDLI